MVQLSSSYYTVVGLIIAAAVIWLVVSGIWIVELNAPTRYLFPPGNDSTVSGYVIAGWILWLFLELSFLTDAFVVILIGTHSIRMTRNIPKEGIYNEDEGTTIPRAEYIEQSKGRTKATRRAEMAITIVAGIIIMIASVYLLVIYSAMLNRCDKYEFCCGTCNKVPAGDGDGDEAAGGCANIRGDFLAQYIFMLLGVIMSFVVAIWSMVIATTPSEAEKAEVKKKKDDGDCEHAEELGSSTGRPRRRPHAPNFTEAR